MNALIRMNVATLTLASVFATVSVQAQTTTANMSVSAVVAGSCALNANPLSFSSYDAASTTDLQASTTVILSCTAGAGSAISMGPGNNVSGTGATAQRRMRLGTSATYMNYNIYQPSAATPGAACAYTTAWGNGTTAGNALTTGVSADGTPRTYNVCATVPHGQTTATTGSYTDTVAVVANL